MATKTPWKPAGVIAAEELAASGGSINTTEHGRLTKLGHAGVWGISQEWEGAELAVLSVVKSNWTQGWTVHFKQHEKPISAFALALDGTTPREEVEQIAQTYMAILNLRRKT